MHRVFFVISLGVIASLSAAPAAVDDLGPFAGQDNDFWNTTRHAPPIVCESTVETDVMYSSLFVRSWQSSVGNNLNTFLPLGFLLFLK